MDKESKKWEKFEASLEGILYELSIFGDEYVTIKLNTIWGLIKKISKVSDSYLCSVCRYKYNDQFYDKYKCSYCGKSHCSIHRLPENHQCYDTKQPPKDFRTIYDGDKIIIKK